MHVKGCRVTLFSAEGCHLCEQALVVVRAAQAIEHFEVKVVDIAGDGALEDAYRTLLPVIEIDGIQAFTHFVTVPALLERVRMDSSPVRGARPTGSM